MLDTGLCQPCRHLEQKRQAEREAEGEDGWVRMEAARLSVLEGAGARDGLRCAPHLHSMLAGEGLLPPHAICSPPESRKPLPTVGTARSRALPTDGGEPDRERGSCLPPPLGPSMVPSTFDFSYPQLTWVWWHRGALGRAPFPIAHAGGTGNNSLSTVLYGFQEGNKWPPVSPIFLLGSGTEP